MLTCFSAVFAEIVSHPIDVMKTRVQYFKTLDVPTTIDKVSEEEFSEEEFSEEEFSEEELNPLVKSKKKTDTNQTQINYLSLIPAVVRHAFYTPLRIFLYTNIGGKNSHLFVKIFSGMISGALAQFTVTPIEVIKVRLQVNKNRATIANIVKNIWKTSGVLGFYYGSIPSVLKSTVTNLVELVCYDVFKAYLKIFITDAFLLHCVTVVITSIFVTFFATPIDVLKTHQMTESAPIYVHIKNIRSVNILLFWSGSFYYWCREVVWLSLFWLTYEYGRQRIGLNEF